ncbi:GAF domain-containing sensor histidine kinase [Actinoallomurus purpureus]|uniref:GAF domain-containing sensor histidine kinase n=1 Tax=Actinoallomurus purpureus TaxID=478114 RepID=UPI0020936AC0|nr:GAF domain-containing sensor histidine kinase [Actinoallomurus purpureus]MCO6009374.1 GAF domain-containing sensor histidine kinase [Actinoallomurus purpureus]
METDRDATLHAVSTAVLAVTRHLSVHEVLQVIVRAAAQLIDARYAALGVPDDEGSFAEFVVEGVSDEEWKRIGPLPRQHGLLALMLRDDRVQRLADVRRDPAFEGWPSAHPVLKDFLGVPIKDGTETLGIIFLANRRAPGGFTAADEELLILFAAHAAIAMTNARLYERNHELTVIEERARLARELHDAVAQKLFSLRLTAAAALSAADPRAELERVQTLAKEALAELREVIFELRPAELAGDGLAESLRKHVRVLDRAWSSGRGHRPKVRFEGDDVTLPSDVEAVVYRVAQEALYNALRHGDPGEVMVRLGPGALEVRDDGSGFDAGAGSRDGLGLASMRERAESVGGHLTIESSPTGTVVRLEVPA